jgi:hypothetical protein
MFHGDYEVPNSLHTEWYPWPEFRTAFEYDDSRGLILEVNCPPGGDTYQLFRHTSTNWIPRRRNIGPYDVDVATNADENTQYSVRADYTSTLSKAYSRFFDTGTPMPRYLEPVVDLVPDRPGTEVRVQWQGAPDDGNGGPGEPRSVFVDNIFLLDKYRHVRFRVDLRADSQTGIVPAVRSITALYEFR